MHGILLLAAALLVGQDSVPSPQGVAAEESLELRYARVRLQLAETNLKRVEQLNQRLDRSVPSSVVAEFKNDVSEADLQFRQAAGDAAQDAFAIWLRRAESSFQAARTRWKNALSANRRVKDTIPVLDVERFRLRAEVAQLQWQRGQALAKGSRDQQLAWQVDLLNDEIELLKEETSRVAPFVRYYPLWLY